jgi:hypothetical protein
MGLLKRSSLWDARPSSYLDENQKEVHIYGSIIIVEKSTSGLSNNQLDVLKYIFTIMYIYVCTLLV